MQCRDHKNIHSAEPLFVCSGLFKVAEQLPVSEQNPNGKTRITWQMAERRTAFGKKHTHSAGGLKGPTQFHI